MLNLAGTYTQASLVGLPWGQPTVGAVNQDSRFWDWRTEGGPVHFEPDVDVYDIYRGCCVFQPAFLLLKTVGRVSCESAVLSACMPMQGFGTLIF